MIIYKSVALLTRTLAGIAVTPRSSFRKAAKRSREARRFSGSSVMQSVPMPITKPGAARCGSGRRDAMCVGEMWSFDPAPTYLRARAPTDWPRGSYRPVLNTLVYEFTRHAARISARKGRYRECLSLVERHGNTLRRLIDGTEERRRGDENQLDRECHSIVTDIPRWPNDVETPGSATLAADRQQLSRDCWRLTGLYVFAEILPLIIRKRNDKTNFTRGNNIIYDFQIIKNYGASDAVIYSWNILFINSYVRLLSLLIVRYRLDSHQRSSREIYKRKYFDQWRQWQHQLALISVMG